MRNKVSPAFEPFLADMGEDSKQDAIVLYHAPPLDDLPQRGLLRQLKRRLHGIKEQASQNRAIEKQLFQNYQEASQDLGYAKQPLSVSPIGSGVLPVATVEVTRKTLKALAAQPDVVAILPNQRIHLIRPQRVEYSQLAKQENRDGLTWGLKQLEIPKLWKTTTGKDINVAVLDTGVHAEHPALRDRVKEFIVIDPLGRRVQAKPSFDCGQHGTHVCGTIAGGRTETGVAIGVAPEANLLVGAVLVGDATLQTLIEGMSWAAEQGADIINMSLGFSYYEPYFAQVLDILVGYDILPVVAIGNENHGNTSSPGNVYNAFSVGAVEKQPRNKVDVAFFSSGASLTFPAHDRHAFITKPDIVAPGVQVYSCIPPAKLSHGTYYQYTYMDGTSMATPHVAGVAALLMAAHPTAPVADIIEVLKETAWHPNGVKMRPDNRWGYGLIQPVKALQALTQ